MSPTRSLARGGEAPRSRGAPEACRVPLGTSEDAPSLPACAQRRGAREARVRWRSDPGEREPEPARSGKVGGPEPTVIRRSLRRGLGLWPPRPGEGDGALRRAGAPHRGAPGVVGRPPAPRASLGVGCSTRTTPRRRVPGRPPPVTGRGPLEDGPHPSSVAARRARFLYTGLRVHSLRRSVRIYRALGLREVLRGRTSLGEYVQLAPKGTTIALEFNFFRRGSKAYEPFRRGTELDHLGFWVDDVDRWVGRLRALGCRVRVPPFDGRIALPGPRTLAGRAAFLIDPDGFWIELMGPRRTRPPLRSRTTITRAVRGTRRGLSRSGRPASRRRPEPRGGRGPVGATPRRGDAGPTASGPPAAGRRRAHARGG